MAVRYCVAALAFLFLYIPPVVLISYCENGEMETWGQHCYYYGYGNWYEAVPECEGMGATLASIHSQEEQEYISSHMTGYADYWIGMVKTPKTIGDKKEDYEWMDGTEVDFERWFPDKPTGRDCVEVHEGYDKWKDSICRMYNEFVCKGPFVRGWQQYNGNEYYISTLPEEIESTWYEARDFCMQQGGDVASILSSDEVKQIKKWSTKTSYKGNIWIGLNKLADDHENWGWSDGSNFSTTWDNWSKLFPEDDKYGYLCGYQHSNDLLTKGKWKNGHCDTKKGFLCKRPITSSPTPKTTVPTQPVDGYCPAGYYGSGNKCFKVVLPGHFGADSLTFEQAVDECRKEPGRLPSLASIENEVDQAFITAHLTSVKFGVWIGLHREALGSDWIWVDSSPYQYENWAAKKPGSSDGNCTEVQMIPGAIGKWNNIQCSDKRGYVCQIYKDPTKIIPTSATPKVNFTCPAGFTPYWYGCYKYQATPWFWNVASEECKKLDPSATLVGIHAEAENAAIQTLSLTKGKDIWLGFRDRTSVNGENGEYKWEDGWHVLWTNWADGQPVKEFQGGCVRMSSDGRWSDDVCSKQYPSVCKISQLPALTTPATVPGTCPAGDGWFEYGEHCYMIILDDGSSWKDAKEKCEEKGFLSTLASVHSYLENKMILDKLNGSKNLWIGLYRSSLDRSRIRWTDGSALQYEAWAPAEPNGEDSREDCVRMWNEEWLGRWGDHKCSDNMGYICKAPKTPNVTLPTSFPHCDEGWIHSLVTGHCYLFKPDESQTYDGSLNLCREHPEADLASIHDPFEMRYIGFMMTGTSNLPPETRDTHYWFGMAMSKAADDTYDYYWTDGTKRNYDHWYDHEPGNPEVNPCVYVDMKSGQWLTVKCDRRHGYVCKKPSLLKPTPKPTKEIPGGGAVGGMVAGGHLNMVLISCLLGLTFRFALCPLGQRGLCTMGLF